MLLLGGARLDTIRNDKTALWRAIEECKVSIATLLVQYGADVNIEGPHGITVSSSFSLAFVKFLS